MGAGLSGLSCAKYLEDHGVTPQIFEKRHRVGERFPNMESVIQLVHRPFRDPLVYINKEYGMNLKPTALTHTIEVYSPHQKAVLSGPNMGYTSIRGHDDRSWECQLYRQIKANICFSSKATWQELVKDFDRVVIATGDPTISRELGVWKTDVEAFLKGCIVKGNFDTGLSKIWINTELSRYCMVYFIPFDTDEGCYCTVAIPSSVEELDVLWSKTVDTLNLHPVPGTEFKYEEYKLGRASSRQIGKVLLVGAAGGFVLPFMGFGQVPSILSGIHAAEAILTGTDYNQLTRWFDKQYHDYLELRKNVEKMDNEGFDNLIALLKSPVMKHLIEHTNIPVFNWVAKVIRTAGFVQKILARR